MKGLPYVYTGASFLASLNLNCHSPPGGGLLVGCSYGCHESVDVDLYVFFIERSGYVSKSSGFKDCTTSVTTSPATRAVLLSMSGLIMPTCLVCFWALSYGYVGNFPAAFFWVKVFRSRGWWGQTPKFPSRIMLLHWSQKLRAACNFQFKV